MLTNCGGLYQRHRYTAANFQGDEEMQDEKTVTLYSQLNGSDKVYVAHLRRADGDLWNVFYQNGKRGSALTTPKAKNASPLPYEAAVKVFDDLVNSKKNGSSKYVEDESVAMAYQAAPEKASTGGFLPQLLNPIREPDVEVYLKGDDWIAQEKMNGERRPVRMTAEAVVGMNKKGDAVAVALSIADGLRSLPASSLLVDGEDMGGELVAFDLLSLDGEGLRNRPYEERFRHLQLLVGAGVPGVRIVRSATGEAAKRALLATLRAEKAEGVVFKRRSALFSPGRPNSGGDQIKFKFTESATCHVESVTNGKRSISVCVYDDEGQPVSMGRVTVPPNHPLPAPGAFVEIEYLYAMQSLVQPVYLGVRNDQDRGDCTLSQIKFRPDAALLAA